MKINKEQPTKKKSGMRMALIALLMALATQMAAAEERRGIITKTEMEGYSYYIHLDTDGNRITDTYLQFPHPDFSPLTSNLQTFIEKGMEVVFDDAGIVTYSSGNREASGDNTISIDGSNMLDLFPNEAARFKFAAEARHRQQAAPAPAPQPSAEEQRIKELEAEVERLRQQLQNSGR